MTNSQPLEYHHPKEDPLDYKPSIMKALTPEYYCEANLFGKVQPCSKQCPHCLSRQLVIDAEDTVRDTFHLLPVVLWVIGILGTLAAIYGLFALLVWVGRWV